MQPAILSDKSQFPTEEIIYSHIGNTKPLWLELFGHIQTSHPDFNQEWRYYNDGKSWLMKVTRKTKTIFWLSIIPGSFRTTFYFTEKAAALIQDSPLSAALKEQFVSGKQFNKIRAITIAYQSAANIEDAKILIRLKLSIK